MEDLDKIENFFTEMERFHANRINLQREELEFYEDGFPVGIVEPFHIVRTGSSARIVDTVVGHVGASSPQVFRDAKKTSEKARASAIKVSRMLNIWAEFLIPEFIESLWNAVLFGEGIFQVEFNPAAYKKNGKNFLYKGDDLPIIVTSPDPMTVYCWPYDSLLPAKVAKMFEMNASVVESLFPAWANPTGTAEGSNNVSYKGYWDDKTRYFEAGKAALKEPELNILGFCPFIHYHSGFGKRSFDGDPASLSVGRLRKLKGLLREDCELTSRIDSIIAYHANPLYRIEQTSENAGDVDLNELKKQTIGPGSTLTVPYGFKAEIYTPNLNMAPLFAHLAEVQQRLGLESPSIMSGVASNSRVSGRQEDIEYEHIQKRFNRLIKNFELAISAVLSRCLQIIDTQPQALPITIRGKVVENGETTLKEEQITKEDIDGYYENRVELNPDKALEDDRNFMKNRMLVNEGRISWKRFLMNGLNLTEWEAEETIAEAIAEVAVRDDPFMSAARTQEAIERMGMERYIKKTQEQSDMTERYQRELSQAGQKQPQVRQSEAFNPAARDIARQLLGGEGTVGVRRPPAQEMQ